MVAESSEQVAGKKDRAARQLARAEEREKRKILLEMENDREQIREAERMLNEVLPEEARKAGAPPGWLRE